MSNNNFNTYSRYYDALYREKNYYEEANYVLDKINVLCPSANEIIELGCGTGNHAAFFCEAGFNVTGLERSAEMVTLAKNKAIKGFDPIIGDISNYRLAKTFDVAVSLFHVISYLTSNVSLVSCFENTKQHLAKAGIFIFDVWYSPAVYHQQPETRVKRLSADNLEIIRLAEPDIDYSKNLVDVNYEIIITNKENHQVDVFKEKHPMRHFSIPEIELLANFTGFQLIQVEEFLTGNQPTQDTWGVCFILQKK